MRVFAIGDLHLDSTHKKPMNIFGDNWINHDVKIFENWVKTVTDEDIVLIPGDISWAMRIDEAEADLEILEKLPGKKICIRGNHDYWWSTKNKLKNLNLKTIEFLNNDFVIENDFIVCGCRGWDTCEPEENVDNEKIYKRELMRFEMSLKNTLHTNLIKIAMLHFPPFNYDKSSNDFVDLMVKYNVDVCVYGHLHGTEGHKLVREGVINGIKFYCVASDYLDFNLKRIEYK